MSRARTRRSAEPTTAGRTEQGPWTTEVRGLARAVAVSGILFAGLFVTGLVLVRQGPGIAVPDRAYADFYATGQTV